MKDKRITKFLIVSVVTIVIIVSTTVNSDFALAVPAIKPSMANLKIVNHFAANCDSPIAEDKCPQGSNSLAHTTITFGESTLSFAACSWKNVHYNTCRADYHIPIGAKYTIKTNVPVGIIYIVKSEKFPNYFYFEKGNIQGGPGGCNGEGKPASCDATMPASGANVVVNYHWGRFPV